MASSNSESHWAATSRLMYIALAIWFFFSFVIHFFVNSLNTIVILGFPLGFWFARKQNDIDSEHGFAEEE